MSHVLQGLQSSLYLIGIQTVLNLVWGSGTFGLFVFQWSFPQPFVDSSRIWQVSTCQRLEGRPMQIFRALLLYAVPSLWYAFPQILAALISLNVNFCFLNSETVRLCFPHNSKLYQQSCVEGLKKVGTGGRRQRVRVWQGIRLNVILWFRRWWYRNYMYKYILHNGNCFRVWCGAVVGLTSFFPLFSGILLQYWLLSNIWKLLFILPSFLVV